MTDDTEKTPDAAPVQAMLVRLRIRMWSGSAVDKAVTNEILAAKGAMLDAGSFSKKLLNPVYLSNLRAAAASLRELVRDSTRFWDEGRRCVPERARAVLAQSIEQYSGAFNYWADRFVAGYPAAIEEARVRLGSLFNEADYPDPSEIRGMFGVDVSWEPVPEGQFVPMWAEDRDALILSVEEQTRKLMNESAAELFMRTRATIERFADKLANFHTKSEAGERTAFHASMFDELTALSSSLPMLNLENDPFLNDVLDRLQSKILTLRNADLKNDSAAREDTMAEVDRIIASMARKTVAEVEEISATASAKKPARKTSKKEA